jgi:hypothetical protein
MKGDTQTQRQYGDRLSIFLKHKESVVCLMRDKNILPIERKVAPLINTATEYKIFKEKANDWFPRDR